MDGHRLELTEELVDLLKRSTDGHQFWGQYLEKLSVSEPSPFSLYVHLAILLEPYLQYILPQYGCFLIFLQIYLATVLDHLEAAKVEASIAQVETIIQTELQEIRSFANGRA